MTPDQAGMVAFLRDRYADGIELAQTVGLGLIYQSSKSDLLSPDQAEAQALSRVHAAQARLRFLDETVVPYLSTAGPTGRIADVQLRMLADEHREAHGYEEGWAP